MSNSSKKSSSSKSSTSSDEEEIKKVSSGYTNEEIQQILSEAKNTHVALTNDLTNKTTKNKSSILNAPKPKTECSSKTIDEPAYFELNGQPLRIQLGFSVERDVKINETRLHSGFDTSEWSAVKHLYFQGDAGCTIDCTALIRNNDEWIGEEIGDQINYKNRTVLGILNDICRTFTICKIVSMSELIENGYYRMTSFKPIQTYNNYVQVDITFVQDTYTYQQPLQSFQSMSDIDSVVIQQGGVDKSRYIPVEWVSGGTSTLTGLAKELNDCGILYKHCTCTTKKKATCVTTSYVKCVYTLQKALRRVGLYFDGKLDGLYCYVTYNAVLKFQKQHQDDSENPLTPTGRFDTRTKEKLVELIK